MSSKGKRRGAHEHSKDDDGAAGFSKKKPETGTAHEFLYDVDVDKFKIQAFQLYNASKQLYKLQSQIHKKQDKQDRVENYKSKRLEKCQETYHSELTEAEKSCMAITHLLHRDAPEAGKLDRTLSERKEKRPKREHSQDSRDRAWEVTVWREKHKTAEDDRDKHIAMYLSLQDEVERFKQDNDGLREENAKLRKELLEREKKIKDLQSENATLLRNYKQEKAEKDDALTRLSAVASSKIRDNNPNIADLSDVNRPTKIAEKMSELYDNEWTDAFDRLEKSKPDTDVVKALLDILKTINTQCCEMAWQNFFPHVQNAIELPARVLQKSKANTSPEDKMILTKEMQQQIKEIRKLRAPSVLPIIKNELLPKDIDDEMRSYYNTCVEVCWLAAVQDPPLFMNFNPGEKFDTTLFKDYTARGPYVEFLVWPALHLHDKGPLLSKGVAQGSLKHPLTPERSQPHMKDERRSFRSPKNPRSVKRSNSNTTS